MATNISATCENEDKAGTFIPDYRNIRAQNNSRCVHSITVNVRAVVIRALDHV